MRNRTGILFLISSFLIFGASTSANAEGALAAGRDARGNHWFGVSYNKSSIQEARNGAMQTCLQKGPNCSVAATFRNRCFAIAYGRFPDRRSGYEWVTRATLQRLRAL
jgi:hypothetical protein